MKTPPQGITMDRLIPGMGSVTLPVSDAPQLWSSFSKRADADVLMAKLGSDLSFQGQIFDCDPNSGQFRYALVTGPRMWGIRGIATDESGVTSYTDCMVGDMLDRRPNVNAKLRVVRIAEAGSEITDNWPAAKFIGELHWA